MSMQQNQTRSASSIPDGQVIADFKAYPEAVTYVDRLVNNNFPPQLVAIIGSDLKLIERVRSKLSYGRVALGGAFTGSWMGLMFAILFGSSSSATASTSFGSFGSYIVIGAGIGMLFAVVRYSLTRNKKEFLSGSAVVAARYEVMVPTHMVQNAIKAASTEA
jgi:hypothetical protein